MRLIDADALIAETMKNRCADCDRRKGIKQGKTTFVYDFGEAPCRACDVGDMIDTLDEATTISGWISVKDRLPNKGQIVIASDGEHTWDVGMYKSFCGKPSEWNWKKNTVKTVLWWMPKDGALPEPQKEDKYDE